MANLGTNFNSSNYKVHNNMYIKIATSSPLGQQLSEMWERGAGYGKKAFEWAAQQGADYVRGEFFCIFGGVCSAHFNSKPPKGWIKAGPKYDEGEYRIGTSPDGKALRKYADALPKITDDEFNKLLNYDENKRTTNKICFHPGIQWGKDNFILINIPDHTHYTPIADMVEITVTEYKALQKDKKEADDE
jgi:hypothetical protein